MVVWTGRVWIPRSSCVLDSVSLVCVFFCLFLICAIWFHSSFNFLLYVSLLRNVFVSRYDNRPILYSIAGLGIAIVNDFKSIEGDRSLGLHSLPVAFGVDGAKWICAASVTLTQLGVAGYLYAGLGETTYALILLALILPQMYFQATLLLPDPINNDVKYQASSQPFLVFGILATALCVGHHNF